MGTLRDGFLRADEFVEEAGRFDVPWTSPIRSTRYLELFDEAGLLRPIYRLRFPREYAVYRAERVGKIVARPLPTEERERFAELDSVVESRFTIRPSSDPAQPTVFEEPPPSIASYLTKSTPEEVVAPEEWHVEINKDEQGRSYTYPHVVSLYAPWQLVRYWCLLEASTVRILLTPRRPGSEEHWLSRDPELHKRILSWNDGPGARLVRILDGLERDGWLATLNRVGACLSWSAYRLHDPARSGWPDGDRLSFEERVALERPRVRMSISSLSSQWLGDRPDFLARLRLLIDLRQHLTALHSSKLEDLLRKWIILATRWAWYLYAVSFDDLSKEVGPIHPDEVTLSHVLRPSWQDARETAQRWLATHCPTFNKEVGVVRLESEDPQTFLTFLDEEGLSSWQLELALLNDLRRDDDSFWDRQFLQLRSLAMLHEPILSALASRYGTISDKEKVRDAGVWESMATFLTARADWRGDLWKLLTSNYSLTGTTGGRSIVSNLSAIHNLSTGSAVDAAARIILTRAAIRHYGSHQYLRDTDVLYRFGDALVQSVTFCSMFYWKVATTLG